MFLPTFVVAAVRKGIPLSDVFKGSMPFLPADFAVTGIFIVWPEAVTWLPDKILATAYLVCSGERAGDRFK